jgi:hypothetical protein
VSLERRSYRWLPPGLTLKIQVALGAVGVVGLFVAPFLPLRTAVLVINEVSMITLVVAALAGIDSARNPPAES